jgi:magnesium chelatase subunit I
VAPSTLAELREYGYEDRTVKEELRANLVARLRSGEPLATGVVGYDDTVLPELERALLAGQDLILLGERGQAKTRIVRRLMDLLDETAPIIAGCEINCSPLHPTCAHCRRLATETGEQLPIVWIDRERRFAEKLATPDTAVADLIGDVDPIKVAEGRTLGDEETIHWGLVTTAASSRSTSCPTCPNASRWRCSTCSRNATCRSAATRSGSRWTCCSSRPPIRTTTPTADASSRR